MPIELPTVKIAALCKSPRKLLIYSAPKMGKTTLSAGLEDALLIDLEDGSDYVVAKKIKITNYQELHDLCEEVKKQGRPYKYGIVDTATKLEELCLPLALKLYQQTPMGKTYTGSILALPNGAGYLYLRNAFELLLSKLHGAFDRVILLGHLKDKFIEKGGKEVSAKDIDLTGKLKSITCANADAIGYLYRDGKKTMLSFNTSEEIICGARPAHLRNKEFVLAEELADGTFETYWDKIFID